MGDSDEECTSKGSKASNVLPLWGNERTMNLNPLILTNIQSSHYFKVNLYELKTYHEVVDEIYYKVQHLEPWEKGSRRTSGQTGMCGGVRGVGAGGIVSTAYCLLYKLFTLKLTRKQLNGLISHCDSPYIRALGFMYMRYVFPPASLIDWYEPYFDDEEEMDVKAGGGQVMRLGMILRQWLVKLEWFSTLFPRIPVPIQQKIQKALEERFPMQAAQVAVQRDREERNDRERNRGEVAARLDRGADRWESRDKDAFRDDRTNARDRRDRQNDKPREDRYREERNNDFERKDRHDFDRKDADRNRRDDFERKDRLPEAASKDRLRDDYRDRKHRDRSPHKERHHRHRDASREREHKHKRHHRS